MDDTQLLECTQALPEGWDDDEEGESSAQPELVAWLQVGETKHEIFEGETKIGRDPATCKIVLAQKVLSKEHAIIEVSDGTHTIADLGSMNKTRIGKMVLKPQVRYALQGEETIRFGDVETKYSVKPKSVQQVADDSGSETGSESMLALNDSDDRASPLLTHQLPGLDISDSAPIPVNNQSNPESFLDDSCFVPETQEDKKKSAVVGTPSSHLKTFIPATPSTSQSTPVPQRASLACIPETPANVSAIQKENGDDSFFFELSQPRKEKETAEEAKKCNEKESEHEYNSDASTDIEEDDIPTQLFADSPTNMKEAEKKVSDADNDIFLQATQAYTMEKQSPGTSKPSTSGDTLQHVNEDEYDDTQEIVAAFEKHGKDNESSSLPVSKNNDINEDDDDYVPTQLFLDDGEDRVFKKPLMVAPKSKKRVSDPPKGSNSDGDLFEDDLLDMPTQPYIDDTKARLTIPYDKDLLDAPTQEYFVDVPVQKSNSEKKEGKDDTKSSKPIGENHNQDDIEDIFNQPTQVYSKDDVNDYDAPTQPYQCPEESAKLNDSGANSSDDNTEDISNQPTQPFICKKNDYEDDSKSTPVKGLHVDDDNMTPTQLFEPPNAGLRATKKLDTYDDDDDDLPPTQLFTKHESPAVVAKQMLTDDDLPPTQLFASHDPAPPKNSLANNDADDDLAPTQLFIPKDSAVKTPNRVAINDEDDDDLPPTQLYSAPDPVQKPAVSVANNDDNDDDDLPPTQLFTHDSPQLPKKSAVNSDDDLPPTQLFTHDRLQKASISPKRKYEDPVSPRKRSEPPVETKLPVTVHEGDDDLPPTQLYHAEAGKLMENAGLSELHNKSGSSPNKEMDDAYYDAPTQPFIAESAIKKSEGVTPKKLNCSKGEKMDENLTGQRGASEVWDGIDADETQDITLDTVIGIDEAPLKTMTHSESKPEEKAIDDVASDAESDASETLLNDNSNIDEESENELQPVNQEKQTSKPEGNQIDGKNTKSLLKSKEKISKEEENYLSDESTDIELDVPDLQNKSEPQSSTNIPKVMLNEPESHEKVGSKMSTPRSSQKGDASSPGTSSPRKRKSEDAGLEDSASCKTLPDPGRLDESDSTSSVTATGQISKTSEMNKSKFEFRKVYKNTHRVSLSCASPEAKMIERRSTPDSCETEDFLFLDIQFEETQDLTGKEKVSENQDDPGNEEEASTSKRTLDDLSSDSDSGDEGKLDVSQKLFELTPDRRGDSSVKKEKTSPQPLPKDVTLKRKLPFDGKSEESENSSGCSDTPSKKRRNRSTEEHKEAIEKAEETSKTKKVEVNKTAVGLHESMEKTKVSPKDNKKNSHLNTSSNKAALSSISKRKQNSSEKLKGGFNVEEKTADIETVVDDESGDQESTRSRGGRSRKRTLELANVTGEVGDKERDSDMKIKIPKIKEGEKLESLPRSSRGRPSNVKAKGEQKSPKRQIEEEVQKKSPSKSLRIKSSVRDESDQSSTSATNKIHLAEESQKEESVPRSSRSRKSVVKAKDCQGASSTRSSKNSVEKETDPVSRSKRQSRLIIVDDSENDTASRDSSDFVSKVVTVDDVHDTRRRKPRTYSSSSTVSIQSHENGSAKGTKDSTSGTVSDAAVQGRQSRRSKQKDAVSEDRQGLSLSLKKDEAGNSRGRKGRTSTLDCKQKPTEISEQSDENKKETLELTEQTLGRGRRGRNKKSEHDNEKIATKINDDPESSNKPPTKIAAGDDGTSQASTSTAKGQENLAENNESLEIKTNKTSRVSQRNTGVNITGEHSNKSSQKDVHQEPDSDKPKETRSSRGKNKNNNVMQKDLQPLKKEECEEKSANRKSIDEPVNESNSQIRTSGRSRREPRRFSPERESESESIVPVTKGRRSSATKLTASTSSSQNSDDISTSRPSRRGQKSTLPDEEVEIVPARAKSIQDSDSDSRNSESQEFIALARRGRRTTIGKLQDITEDKSKGTRKNLSDEKQKPDSQQASRRGRASIATSQPSTRKSNAKTDITLSTVPEVVEKEKCSRATRGQKNKNMSISSKEHGEESSQQEPESGKGKMSLKRKSRMVGPCKGNADEAVETKTASDVSDKESESSQDSFKGKRKPKSTGSVLSTPKSGSNVRSKQGSPYVGDKVLWSPSQRQQQASNRPRVLFTGYKDTQDEKIVNELGGKVVESARDCTVLVTTCVRRTCKLLAAMGKGLPVVTPSWLTDSKQAGNFVDPWEYLVKDVESETKYGFRLEQSLRSASKFQLFEGLEIHATKSVKPPPDQMKEIIECSGGTYLDMPPKRYAPPIRIVSCPEDKNLWTTFRRVGIPILGTEFVLTGLLRHQLLLDDFELK